MAIISALQSAPIFRLVRTWSVSRVACCFSSGFCIFLVIWSFLSRKRDCVLLLYEIHQNVLFASIILYFVNLNSQNTLKSNRQRQKYIHTIHKKKVNKPENWINNIKYEFPEIVIINRQNTHAVLWYCT